MELEQLKQLTGQFEELKKAIEAERVKEDDVQDLIDQYDLENHAIMDKDKRPDKKVTTDDGDKYEPVARIPVPFQKIIVSRAAQFLCGNPIELSAIAEKGSIQDDLLTVIKKTWEDNKLDYESKKLAKIMMSECECAELWYTEPAAPEYWADTPLQGSTQRLRMRVLAPSLGDTLYPVYNSAGDMIAFARGFNIKGVDGKLKECFDVYTAEFTYYNIKEQNGWQPRTQIGQDGQGRAIEPNPSGKIPVIYYHQDKPEWADVQPLIDHYETMISNHAESNKYYAFPMLALYGEVVGMASKGEQGKVLQLENGARAEMLTANNAPESLSLEYTNVRSHIFDMSDTPDITSEKKDFSGPISGEALKMRFLPALLKAADKEELFGKSIQRRINFLKTAHARINMKLEKAVSLSIKPKFTPYLPESEREKIDLLSTAVTSKFISRKTAVALNPFVSDPEAEEEQLKEEANSAGALNEEMN